MTLTIPARAQEKPGTLELVIGIAMMLIAPFVLVLNGENAAKYARMKAEGVVAEAVVKGKFERSESYTDRKGRPKTRTSYFIHVEHDLLARTTYAEWQRTGTVTQSPYPALSTSDIDVGSSAQAALAVGQKVSVIMLPSDSSSLMLTERLESETSLAFRLKWYAAMAALFLAGLAVMVRGWRKRKAHG